MSDFVKLPSGLVKLPSGMIVSREDLLRLKSSNGEYAIPLYDLADFVAAEIDKRILTPPGGGAASKPDESTAASERAAAPDGEIPDEPRFVSKQALDLAARSYRRTGGVPDPADAELREALRAFMDRAKAYGHMRDLVGAHYFDDSVVFRLVAAARAKWPEWEK